MARFARRQFVGVALVGSLLAVMGAAYAQGEAVFHFDCGRHGGGWHGREGRIAPTCVSLGTRSRRSGS